ncbi:MAG: 2Fe-2S iron-sulfur cluster binding domain-containing protein [Limnohabitans sp.]|jgi:2Fe-2S ferredoxin|nr:2Fe-2S iron-sulfur cluster binding domain-containing protein [Limnohabitans sp.]
MSDGAINQPAILSPMLTLKITTPNGAEHDVSAQPGRTLLQIAQDAGLDGLSAECGGSCVCATCHCLVHEDDLARVAPPADDEAQMLDFTATGREAGSRLACQLRIEAGYDGLRVRIAERQY